MMVRLKTRQLALERGISLSRFQLQAGLPLSTARRYWWSSRTGMARDEGTLKQIDLETIERISRVLAVDVGQLLERC